MESLRRFCRNSVPVYFTKIKGTNANKQDGFDEDGKPFLHSDYLCNVLAQEQVTKFYNAAYNVEYLFKNGAFRIKLASDAWKVKDACKVMDEGVATPLSKMGVKLVEITSILENLLQRDPFLFYTAGDRKLISQLLIPLNKSMGKLERKISRLCQRVDEHRKVISELASRYKDCEDDHTFYIEADESDTESMMDTATTVVLNKRQPDKLNKKLLRLWLFLTCTSKISEESINPSKHPQGRFSRRIQSRRLSCKEELIGFSTAQAPQDFMLSNKTRISDKASECTSAVEIMCPPMDSSTANFIISALTPPISNMSNSELQKGNMDEWRKQSYERVLQDALLQNPGNDIDTFDDFYPDFQESSRALNLIQKKIDEALSADYSQESFDLKYEKHVSIKSLKESESGNQNASSFTDCKYEMGSACYTEGNEENCNPGESTVEIFDRRMEYCVADAVFTINDNKDSEGSALKGEEQICKSEKCGNTENIDCMKTQSGEILGRFPLDPMTCYEYNVSEMLSYVNDLTNCLRSLECSWLEPYRDEKIKGNPKRNKELAEIVDYLVFTITLLEDPLFTRQVYLEDKENIIRALKPVEEAVTSCSNAFNDLTRLTLKDAQYLQKIVDHFPINDTDIVIYDHRDNLL